MPNAPRKAREKRDEPRKRHNAQDDHEGAAHNPREFDAANPARQPDRGDAPKPRPAKDK